MTSNKLEKLKEKFIQKLATANKKMIDGINKEYKKANIELEKYYNYEQAFFIRDGNLIVSGECGLDTCDYYGEYRGGYSWINPILEEEAEKIGCFWEWENPACIVLSE